MNIVMLLANPFRPDTRVLKEAEGLSSQGYAVTVICWDRAAEYPPQETLPGGTQIVRVQQVRSAYGIGAAQLLKLPLFWLAALKILAQIKPDLVHCHDFDTLPVGLMWGKPRQVPVIYDAHEYYADLTRPRLHGIWGGLLYHAIWLAEQIGAKLSDAVITVDRTLAEIYRKLNRRVLILGHYPLISMANKPGMIFQRDELHLLYAGRISTDRGMLLNLDLLRTLRQRGIPARLVLAGAFIPAKEEERFSLAGSDMQDWITRLGWVPYQEMQGVLRRVDIGLAILLPEPRFIAALPVKLLEYMAAGLPVIASDFPLIREIVQTHACGVLIDPSYGIEPIADAITACWEDRQAAREMGERGRQAILQDYNWEKLMGDLTQLYQTLLI